ncbi:MAG: sulfate transporter CysZ [Gammaproteobacteria bacterium]
MSSQLLLGAGYVVQGMKLISKPRLRRFVVIPLSINIVIFAAGLFALGHAIEWAVSYLPQWLQWLRWLLWPLFVLASFVVVFYTFSIIANVIASPFNGFLSAAVERYLLEEPRTSERLSLGAVYRELARTIFAEIRKLLYFVLWAIPCLILFLIPGLNLAAPLVWFAFGAWMLAIEYVDCPLGNHEKPYPVVKKLLARRRRLALGFGFATMLLTLIPVVNFIAMPVGVAGATALYLDHMREDED